MCQLLHVSDHTKTIQAWFVYSSVFYCFRFVCHCLILINRNVLPFALQLFCVGGIANLTMKEVSFIIYTSALSIINGTLLIILCIHSFQVYSILPIELLAHDVTLILYSVITSSLPIRVARYEARKAKNIVLGRWVSVRFLSPTIILISSSYSIYYRSLLITHHHTSHHLIPSTTMPFVP